MKHQAWYPPLEASEPEELVSHTPTAGLLCWWAGQAPTLEQFLSKALGAIGGWLDAEFGAFVKAEQGRWQVLAQTGPARRLPQELLAECLDSQQIGLASDDHHYWLMAPLTRQLASQEIVTFAASEPWLASQQEVISRCQELMPLLGRALDQLQTRHQRTAKIHRLETLLEIASQWNQTREMIPLLTQMAEAATRLLEADRASIFLWDKKTRQLVGRPALGVEGNELRIPDDAGVVGRVMQTGEPQRVSEKANPEWIDRKVDQQLGYQTKNLLCVPLHGSTGERFGVFEVINKKSGDFSLEDQTALRELAYHAGIALENAQEREELLETRRQIAEQAAQHVQLIGESPAMVALRSKIERIADTDLTVLILGENGTGKEVVSQSIHYLSRRRDEPFIAVNCAAIPETLLESELFGHEKGAFTDAHEPRAGKFELAASGTLFLDEIGDMPLSGQAKLLRVLEERVVVRVGGSKPIYTDARVIAATNQNLAEMVREKRFRQDLYYRLDGFTLTIPPLRERAEDVVLLCEHFLADFCRKARRRPVPKFSDAARRKILNHAWPGNVRELRNAMERIAYLTSGSVIEPDDLAFILSPAESAGADGWLDFDQPLAEATREFQIQYIRKAIDTARGNMTEAAEQLGLHRSNLYRKMRQLGMQET